VATGHSLTAEFGIDLAAPSAVMLPAATVSGGSADAHIIEPRNLREAKASPEWPQWQAAMREEVAKHESHETF
jgi:hypothetical protein